MENKILISLAKKGFDTEIRDAVQGYIAGMNDSELLSFEQSLARIKAGSKRTFTKNTIKFAQWYYEKTGTYIFPVLQSNGIDLDTGLWRWWMVSLVDPCIVVGSCELSKCVKNLDSLVLTFNANSVDVDCLLDEAANGGEE